ncbi:tetratricopeptide repeat protein [Prochlorococcus sp. AH-736-A13]|nr:tetratricopeptide repeat protein [Prochlorococcus sp. AH-736-A13]
MNISIKKFWKIFLLLFCISNTKIVKSGLENEYKKQQLRQDCKYEIANYFALKTENKFCIKEGLFFEISPEDEILNLGNIEMDLQLSNKNINMVHKFLLENDEFVEYKCKKSKKNANLICDGKVSREVLAAKNNKGKLSRIRILSKNLEENSKIYNLLEEDSKAYDLFERGSLKYEVDDYKGAIADFKKVTKLLPLNQKLWMNGILALSYLHNGEYQKSLENFNKSIEFFGKESPFDLSSLYLYRGIAKFYLDNINGSIIDAEKAAKISPEDSSIHYWLGYVHFINSEDSIALKNFKKVSALDKDFYLENNDFLYYLGRVNLNLGNYLIAISHLSEYIELNPDSVSDAYLYRGDAYQKLGFLDLAMKDYSDEIKFNSDDDEGYSYRGLLNFEQENYVAALNDFDKLIEITPDLELKNLSIVLRVVTKNLIFFEEYINNESFTDIDSLSSYEEKKLKINIQKNIDEISEVIKITRDSRLYFLRGLYYNLASWIPKNNLLALDDLNKAIELDNEIEDYLIKRGEIKLELNKNESAMEDFNKAIKINPDSVKAYSNRGQLKKNLKDFKGYLEDQSKKNKLRSIELDSLLD